MFYFVYNFNVKFNMVGGKMLNETLSQGYGHHSEDECI